MNKTAITKEVRGKLEDVIEKVTNAIKPAGFGILTRIDFDQKIKEKLNESIPRTVVLGACNPRLAFEAYKKTTDVALYIPCNIVVREVSQEQEKVMVEAIRPSAMLGMLPGLGIEKSVGEVEKNLENAIMGL